MSGTQAPAPPQGRVIAFPGSEAPIGAEPLKWAAGVLLGLRDFLTNQIPPSAREGDWKLLYSDKVQSWDVESNGKSIQLTTRVGQRVSDAIGIARKTGSGVNDPAGMKISDALKTIDLALVAINAALDKTEAPAAAAVPLKEAAPSQGLSKTAKIALVVGCTVAVVGTIAVGIYMVNRSSSESKRVRGVRE